MDQFIQHPTITYVNCDLSDFYIEYRADFDDTNTDQIDVSQYSVILYPKCTDGSWFEYEEEKTESWNNGEVYRYGPEKHLLDPKRFNDISNTGSNLDYLTPAEKYKVDGNDCYGEFYFCIPTLPCFKNSSYTFETSVSIIKHSQDNLDVKLSALSCNVTQLIGFQSEKYTYDDDGEQQLSGYDQTLYVSISSNVAYGENPDYRLRGNLFYDVYKAGKSHVMQNYVTLESLDRISSYDYGAFFLLTIDDHDKDDKLTASINVRNNTKLICILPAEHDQNLSSYNVRCHSRIEHNNWDLTFNYASAHNYAALNDERRIPDKFIRQLSGSFDGFFDKSIESHSNFKYRNLRKAPSGYEFLDAFMPDTKDYDYVYEIAADEWPTTDDLPLPLSSMSYDLPKDIKFRPYGQDWLVECEGSSTLFTSGYKFNASGNDSKRSYFKHAFSKMYAGVKDPPSVAYEDSSMSSRITFLADCRYALEEDGMTIDFDYDKVVRLNFSNAVVMPVYDYRVKFLDIQYDPPLSDYGDAKITSGRNAHSVAYNSKLMHDQLNAVYGQNTLDHVFDVNWLYIPLDHASVKEFKMAMKRLSFCDKAIVLCNGVGVNSRTNDSKSQQGIVVAHSDSLSSNSDDQIVNFNNAKAWNDKAVMNYINKYIDDAVVIAPVSHAGAAIQPGVQETSDPMTPAYANISSLSSDITHGQVHSSTWFASTQLGSKSWWREEYSEISGNSYIYNADDLNAAHAVRIEFPTTYCIRHLIADISDDAYHALSNNVLNVNLSGDAFSHRTSTLDEAVFKLKKNIFSLISDLYAEYRQILQPSFIAENGNEYPYDQISPILTGEVDIDSKYGNGCYGDMCAHLINSFYTERSKIEDDIKVSSSETSDYNNLWKYGSYCLGRSLFALLDYRDGGCSPYGGFIDILYLFMHTPLFLSKANALATEASGESYLYFNENFQTIHLLMTAVVAFVLSLEHQQFDVNKIKSFIEHRITITSDINNAIFSESSIVKLNDVYNALSSLESAEPNIVSKFKTAMLEYMDELIECSKVYDNASNFIEKTKTHIARLLFKAPNEYDKGYVDGKETSQHRGLRLLFSAMARFIYKAGQYVMNDAEAESLRKIFLIDLFSGKQLSASKPAEYDGSTSDHESEYPGQSDQASEAEIYKLVTMNQYIERVKNIILFVGLLNRPHASCFKASIKKKTIA